MYTINVLVGIEIYFCNWFISTPLLTYVGSDRPALKYLNRYVVPAIAPKWYDVGLELMDIQDEKELNVIRVEQSISDDKERAIKMLTVWRDKKIDASWNDILKVLKICNIGLNSTAFEIERLLLPESVFYLYFMAQNFYDNKILWLLSR